MRKLFSAHVKKKPRGWKFSNYRYLTSTDEIKINLIENNIGFLKECKKCKKEFFTGKRRNRVLCPDCKAEKNRPKQYEKICPVCQQSFIARRSDAVTCRLSACRKALSRMNKTKNKRVY